MHGQRCVLLPGSQGGSSASSASILLEALERCAAQQLQAARREGQSRAQQFQMGSRACFAEVWLMGLQSRSRANYLVAEKAEWATQG